VVRGARYRRRRAGALVLLAVLVAALIVIVLAVARPADTHGARVLRYSIASPLLHRTLAQVAVIAPDGGAAGRGLVVFLHGKGQNQESNLVPQMFEALARLGPRAPDLVFPYGGEDSYWHDRRDGAWGSYVMREVIPEALARTHADPRRVAIAGLSMGGFGAYDLARSNASQLCAVGADSAALWRTGSETAPGAFDDEADFAAHDVLGYARRDSAPYAGLALWLDVGSEDPLRSADTQLASELRAHGRTVSFHVWPGGHDPAYWSSHWSSYLAFYARAMAACRP
jgi:S-formylglutathione hydrolase FrmB